jgi:hypothetical protein
MLSSIIIHLKSETILIKTAPIVKDNFSNSLVISFASEIDLETIQDSRLHTELKQFSYSQNLKGMTLQ